MGTSILLGIRLVKKMRSLPRAAMPQHACD
jgi:hypothetical protein